MGASSDERMGASIFCPLIEDENRNVWNFCNFGRLKTKQEAGNRAAVLEKQKTMTRFTVKWAQARLLLALLILSSDDMGKLRT